MRNRKAEWPVITVAFAALSLLLYFMTRIFLAEPYSVHTPPPAWIDPVTGRPRKAMSGSGKPQGIPGSGGAAAAGSSGQPGP